MMMRRQRNDGEVRSNHQAKWCQTNRRSSAINMLEKNRLTGVARIRQGTDTI